MCVYVVLVDCALCCFCNSIEFNTQKTTTTTIISCYELFLLPLPNVCEKYFVRKHMIITATATTTAKHQNRLYIYKELSTVKNEYKEVMPLENAEFARGAAHLIKKNIFCSISCLLLMYVQSLAINKRFIIMKSLIKVLFFFSNRVYANVMHC